jgi:hypothetical protein
MPKPFGGLIYQAAPGITFPTASVGASAGEWQMTRNAANDLSWNNVAGVATTYAYPDFSVLARPYIQMYAFPGQGTTVLSNEFQEAFGTTPASAGVSGPSNPFSGIAASTTAGSSSLVASQFGTPPVPWGLALLDVFAVYSVSTAALTACTLGVSRVFNGEAAANTITSVLAATTIALTTTATAATCHVQKVALAQPLVFESADFSSLSIEMVITTASTSAVRLYGIGCHVVIGY